MARKLFLVALLTMLLIHSGSALPINLSVGIQGGAAYTVSPSVILSLSADNTSASTNCTLSNDGSSWSVPFAFAASSPWNLTSGEGQKNVYFRCTDDGENWSSIASGGIILDTGSPAISSLSPSNGSLVTAVRPTLSASLSDSGSGVNSSTVVMKLDGSSLSATYSSGTVLYSPSSDLTETRHSVELTAYDQAGNGAYANWSFIVDKAPVISTVSPADGSILNSGSFAISAAVSDSGSGINASKISLIVNGNDVTADSTYSSGAITYSASLGEGNNSMSVTVYDLSGSAATRNWSVIVDKTPPVIGNLTPDDGSEVENITSISATITDPLGGVNRSSLQMKVDGRDVTPATIFSGGTLSFAPGILQGGNHSVEVWADDPAGNSAYKSWTFSVFSIAPAVDSLAPPDGSASKITSTTISARVTDSGTSGLNLGTLRLYVDGADVSSQSVFDNGTRVISFTPTSPLSEGNHTARVVISDNLGNRVDMTWSFSIDTTPPQPPSGLSVSAANGTDTLSWDASTDAVSYNVYRSQSQSASLSFYSLLGSSASPSYTDETAPEKSYYAVTETDAAGNEGAPAYASACATFSNGAWSVYACCSDADCGSAFCNMSSHSCFTPAGFVSKADAGSRLDAVRADLDAASNAGKNVSAPADLLNQAADAYNAGNYSMAVQLADQADLGITTAPMIPGPPVVEQSKPLCGGVFLLLGLLAAALFVRK